MQFPILLGSVAVAFVAAAPASNVGTLGNDIGNDQWKGTEVRARSSVENPDFFPFPANQTSDGMTASTSAGPMPNGTFTPWSPFKTTTLRRIVPQFVDKKCSAYQVWKIKTGWDDAKLLAQAQTNFDDGYDYNVPFTQWLGADWNWPGSWIPYKYNFRKIIGNNLRRLSQMFSNNAQSGEYVYWSCSDPKNVCPGDTIAYAWNDLGWFWSNHYVNFCDPYYKAQTLQQNIAEFENNGWGQKIMDYFQDNTGVTMLHEIMHFKQLIGDPHIVDDKGAYGARGAWDLALNKGTDGAYINAENYALSAMAIYAQKHYKTRMPPVPYDYVRQFDATASGPAPPPSNRTASSFEEGPPSGWVSPKMINGVPDPSQWIPFNPDTLDNESDWPPKTTATPTPTPPAPTSVAPTTTTTAPPPPEESCNTQWEVLWDTFDIKGNFDVGSDGSGIKNQVAGCGLITDWSFNTIQNSEFTWEASGRLPIWTQDCVQRAIHSAGGTSGVHCSGHG